MRCVHSAESSCKGTHSSENEAQVELIDNVAPDLAFALTVIAAGTEDNC